MVDDRPEDTPPLPDSGRPKRAPPTIDLEGHRGVRPDRWRRRGRAGPSPNRRPSRSRSRIRVQARAGIGANAGGRLAADRGDAGFALGRGGAVRRGRSLAGDRRGLDAGMASGSAGRPGCAASQCGCDRRSHRPDRQCRVAAPASPQHPRPIRRRPARVEALEKSVVALRGELAAARAQSDKVASVVNDLKSTPGATSPPPDLSAINERIAQIERASRAQSAEIAQDGAKPADDAPLRRVVVASHARYLGPAGRALCARAWRRRNR